MRKEALLEQWKQLYEAATRIKELKPWEKLWDMDLIAVRSGAKEDTVFYSILAVSYTHLDVYKRQPMLITLLLVTFIPALTMTLPELIMK